MNISKYEQRVLHVLARGGLIRHERNQQGKIAKIICYSREGWVLEDCTLSVFKRLKARGLISSRNGNPYEITYLGRRMVRSQLDNRS